MKRIGKLIAFLLTVMCLSLLTVSASAASVVESGTEGNLSWSLDDAGVLTISGSGTMEDGGYSWRGAQNRSGISITKVVIKSGVTSIGAGAFWDLKELAQVTIPSTVKSFGDSAFSGCPKLKSVTIPSGVTTLADTFAGCSSLTTVTIPSSVKTIGDFTFTQCTGLKTVTFASGSKLNSIGQTAFFNCSSLTKITLPGSLTSINAHAFESCDVLAQVVIPQSVTTMASDIFRDCPKLKTLGAIGSGSNIQIGMTEIPERAFLRCESLREVRIPDGVTSIGPYAFLHCNLTKLVIPDSVQSLGKADVGDSIVNKEAVTGIRTAGPIGSGCDYEFGWSTTVPDKAFKNFSSLTGITIPSGVTHIGEEAFRNCSSLTSLILPESVTSFGDGIYVYDSCSGLQTAGPLDSGSNIEFGWTTIIPANAFNFCKTLTEIQLPDTLVTIDRYAFRFCTGLTEISIPKSVRLISDHAFNNCKGLTTVRYAGSQNDWNSIQIDNDNDDLLNANIIYGESVSCTHSWGSGTVTRAATCTQTGIRTYTCSKCGQTKTETIAALGHVWTRTDSTAAGGSTNGTRGGIRCSRCNTQQQADRTVSYQKVLSLPTGTKSVGEEAFSSTVAEQVTIPYGVSSIGYKAFYGCDKLLIAVIPSSVSSIGDNAFPDNIAVICPNGSYAATWCDNHQIPHNP